jgi:hypothetical protein
MDGVRSVRTMSPSYYNLMVLGVEFERIGWCWGDKVFFDLLSVVENLTEKIYAIDSHTT